MSKIVSPVGPIWVIENTATGEWLGVHERRTITQRPSTEFGGRIPIFYQGLDSARDAWMRYSCEQEYVVRMVSLPGLRTRYARGPNFGFWPRVVFRKLGFVEEARAQESITEENLEE